MLHLGVTFVRDGVRKLALKMAKKPIVHARATDIVSDLSIISNIQNFGQTFDWYCSVIQFLLHPMHTGNESNWNIMLMYKRH